MREIDTWHLCIGGFTQRLGQRHGMHRLWLGIHAQCAYRACVQVQLHTWRDHWDDVAEHILVSSTAEPAVYVYAYSYGGGWGFCQLARAMRRRGLRIRAAVLSDAVYRSRWVSMCWRSLVGRPRIVVPDSVDAVWWYRQQSGLPCGHEVVAADPERTSVYPCLLVDGPDHAHMDDLAEFQRRALDVAQEAPW